MYNMYYSRAIDLQVTFSVTFKKQKKSPVQIQDLKFCISIYFPNYATDSVKQIPTLYFSNPS